MQVNPCRDNLQEFKANQSQSTVSEDSDGPVGKTLKEYGGATTIHGIPYILEDGRKMFERLLWVSLVILGMVLTIHLSAHTANLLGEIMGTSRGNDRMGMKNPGHSPHEGNAYKMFPPNPHNF